jgi:hypothetical protein
MYMVRHVWWPGMRFIYLMPIKNVPGELWCGIRNRLGSFYTYRVEYHRMEGEGG